MGRRSDYFAGYIVAGLFLLLASQPPADAAWDPLHVFTLGVGLLVIILGIVVILRDPKPHLELTEPRVEKKTLTEHVAPIGSVPIVQAMGTAGAMGSNAPPSWMGGTGGTRTGPTRVFAYGVVSNIKGEADAEGAHLSLTFFANSGDRCFGPIRGRWTRSEEVASVLRRDQIRDVLDIVAGLDETFDIASKEIADQFAYALNTDVTDQARDTWKVDEWKLAPGTYQVLVEVRAKYRVHTSGWIEYIHGGVGMEPTVRTGSDPRRSQLPK